MAGNSFRYDPNYHRFADYLGLNKFDRDNFNIAKKVSLIYDWALNNSKKEDFLAITQEVDKLRKSIGTNDRGKTLLGDLYRYARIKMDYKRERERNQELKKAKEESEKKTEKAHKESKNRIKEIRKEKEIAYKDRQDSSKKTNEVVKEYQKNVYKEPTTKIKVVKDASPKPVLLD